MRLTVGEWLSSWMCREEGVEFSDDNDMLNFKLVLAEPLDNSSDSHVQKFLDQHGGPGLQHIGLTTPNASLTVQIMANHGAQFRKPPPTYYQLVKNTKSR
jgi:4-hydroxyphenylpyruvate dioxygenase-like putative hemolysin